MPKVAEFIASFSTPVNRRIRKNLTLLEMYGSELRYPHSKPVTQGLFELRVIGYLHIRLLYFFYENRVIIAHAFIKKQNKIPRKDIQYALIIRKMWVA
ncbi:MAG: hypothetical protein JWN49_387 [Parcubacteria group bacterium]|nr:hypothetical protein [Parcubacteria group bacterium]